LSRLSAPSSFSLSTIQQGISGQAPVLAVPRSAAIYSAWRLKQRLSAAAWRKEIDSMTQPLAKTPLPLSGLQSNKLSQWETIEQSLASIAPTATPAMVVPLVLAVSGKASWLAYLLATLGIACIARGINVFASRSSSSGSLYSFVYDSLGKWPSLITGWTLLIAYVGTAASVTGGLTNYLWSLFQSSQPGPIPAILLTSGAVVFSAALAYRDVQLSTRLMLWIEAISILLIAFLFIYPGQGSALHLDWSQFQLSGIRVQQVRSGLVLAIFSFVGFESASALGIEAKNPLRTIPRAVLLTALLSGVFFIFTAYAEVVGFGSQVASLQENGAPLQFLARLRGLAPLAPVLAAASAFSFFACTLACLTAAARTLFTMSRDGYLHAFYGKTHAKSRTPHTAVVLVATATLLPPIFLAARHTSPFDIYGWIGSIATYGFLTAYIFVSFGALFKIGRRALSLSSLGLSAGTFVILGLAGWSAFDPDATGPYRWLPYLYFALLAAGVLLSYVTGVLYRTVLRMRQSAIVVGLRVRSNGSPCGNIHAYSKFQGKGFYEGLVLTSCG
jgi:amino acid transporter